MTDSNQAFLRRLRAIFQEEAHEHLQEIEAGLLALEQAGAGAAAQGSLLQAVLKVLHTLKGAARAVDLGDLERLCHALEGVFSAAGQGPAGLAPGQLDQVHQALGLARLLVDAPGGRVRNQAAALAARLDSLSLQLAAPRSHGAAPAAAPGLPAVPGGRAAPVASDEQADGGPDPDPVDAAASGRADRVRVRGKDLDAIRTQGEALLSVELSMRHHIGALRELAEAMADERRRGMRPGGRRAPGAGAARPGAADEAPTSGFELQCARLAESMGRSCAEFAGIRARLMEATLETSLVPFSAALDELPVLVRNLARNRGKQVALTSGGDSIQIDRRVLGVIREALIHLVTNAVDHGIEGGAARLAAGKPAAGAIDITVSQRDSRQVLVRVRDDGCGIDVAALEGAAARAGGPDAGQLAGLDEQQRLRLSLRPGVTTRSKVTPASGRGLGLAIVAEKVAAAGGELRIDSVRGAGCTFEFMLPVTLASMRALVVAAGGVRYIVPLAGIESVRALGGADIQTVENRETVLAGARVIPLIRLAALAGAAAGADMAPAGAKAGAGIALVARAGGQLFGLLVDDIVAEQDVLPKSLGKLLCRVRYITGAARLGDGSLVPVLGLDDLAAHALAAAGAPVIGAGAPAIGAGQGAAPGAASAQRRVLVVEDSITSRLLLKHILEGVGCRVGTAVDGLDALSKLRTESFDAVVSDIEMPRMDGLALTESIRANPATARLPVILVTSLQSPAQRERGLRAGADAYLTKGAFDQDQLLATVRRLT